MYCRWAVKYSSEEGERLDAGRTFGDTFTCRLSRVRGEKVDKQIRRVWPTDPEDPTFMTLKMLCPRRLYNMHTQHLQEKTSSAAQKMYFPLVVLVFLLSSQAALSAEEADEHRDFQYNSVVDPQTGRYNFAYDTGHDNDVAHTLHMQYRDANGIVRGRYGYTDPRGKLRMVEYEAGPQGFVARGDVGPDMFPHDQAPETQVSQVANYRQDEDLDLVPRPVQMAGWNPAEEPMGQPITSTSSESTNQDDDNSVSDIGGFTTNNATGEDYDPNFQSYDVRYPRISTSNEDSTRELEDLNVRPSGEVYPVAGPLTVDNIDVNANDIRMAVGSAPRVGRSADRGTSSRYTSSLPYSYRNYRRSTHDHDAEKRNQRIGYRVVYRPSHDHYNERYYRRPSHDHDAERRYIPYRRVYVSSRHDHDAEKKYASYRRTYVSNRQNHDHDSEKHNYYRSEYYRNRYPYRRRIYYRDSHSDVPHQHYSDVYRNADDLYHQHSDVHLYGKTQNLEYPATVRPRQLKYIPSDKYHGKYYYWTD